MEVKFSKYQGTGNDFVMLNNMHGDYNKLSSNQIQQICNRKIGVGADGLIKLSKKEGYDFELEYFNPDGSQSFCGNGARCSIAFANSLGLVPEDGGTTFLAIDGVHKGYVESVESVKVGMLPVSGIERISEDFVLDTGSPHYVRIIESALDIVAFGRAIRYSDEYAQKGINVNTMDVLDKDKIRVETYERGVEDETLSCGTGVTACALIQMSLNEGIEEVEVETKGGKLSVRAKSINGGFNDIWLTGPIKEVFNGVINV